MKVAVTGASGHIGACLIPLLAEKGHYIKALVRKDTRSLDGYTAELVQGDMESPEALENLVKDAEVVVHSAAFISINGSYKGAVEKTNIEGTRRVLQACEKAGVKRLVYTSSIHAYEQRPIHAELNENTTLVSARGSSYERSKRDAQVFLQSYKGPVEIITVNPTSVIGPPDWKPSLVGKALIDIIHGKVPALIRGGFDFVDSRDVAWAIAEFMQKGTPGENYLLSGKYYPMTEVVNLTAQAYGKKIKLPVMPVWSARMGLPFIRVYSGLTGREPLYTKESIDALVNGNRMISFRKAQEAIGYQSRPLETSVNDLIAWFKQHSYL